MGCGQLSRLSNIEMVTRSRTWTERHSIVHTEQELIGYLVREVMLVPRLSCLPSAHEDADPHPHHCSKNNLVCV